ncbi:HelD family protein [Nakamurella flava]|uniref:HelD family protein n=1 Tax=Nakamurella flava TaxID=2576308 RepID=UPI001F0F009A|nr:ATP-binding domain-containing protein [Nakamurella flava]
MTNSSDHRTADTAPSAPATSTVVDDGHPEPPPAGDHGPGDAVTEEQGFLTELYRRLDALRAERVVLRDRYVRHSDNTPGGRVERDIAYARHAEAVQMLNAAEDKLCFGRLDYAPGAGGDADGAADADPEHQSIHIGRMGIFADSGDHRQLLMDWRAPSARPFYVATAARPLGIRRRRHLQTARRKVTAVTDDYLDLSGLDAAEIAAVSGSTGGLAGEASLLAALQAPRTGRMGDIVATIQAEQDRIIRADRAGILVVQGGPGTGKTAVALHRAAYLLYTYREQLAQRGVLIVGPNPMFLRYIGQVLPSLGENAVVLATVGELFPGVSTTRTDPPGTARLKGRTAMNAVIANAVLHRQAMPARTVEVLFAGAPGGRLQVTRTILRNAQQRAWQSRRPHNRARAVFLKRVLDQLVPQVAERLGRGPGGDLLATRDDLDAIRTDLRESEELIAALAGIWPLLTPQRLLADLFADRGRLAFAADTLSPEERDLLYRAPVVDAADPAGTGRPEQQWTISDVPLLDEAAELLGQIPQSRPTGPDADTAYAEEVLDLLHSGETSEDEAPLVSMLTAADLAALHDDVALLTSTAERAAADREWTFGHVIVDEAQELSPMAWRLIMRRVPVRSMTVVGDLAQTSDPAGATSWRRVFRNYARGALTVEQLTVNYRTPAEIMEAAEPVLARIDPRATAPSSVREAGVAPWHRRVPVRRLAAVVADEAVAQRPSEGLLAVIAPEALLDEVGAAVQGALDAAGQGSAFGASVLVMGIRQAKGLEFDRVLLVEPTVMIGESDRGLNDLYVAMTRSTQTLAVLHSQDLPDVLHRLKDGPA